MEIRVEGETIWMSQQMMAELFQTTKQNVAKHLKRIFEQGELQQTAKNIPSHIRKLDRK